MTPELTISEFTLVCPAPLAAQGFVLRRETAEDAPRLRDLYIRHRWDEFAPLALAEAQKLALLGGQYDLQRRQYLAHYADARFYVLERDGALIARLMLGEAAGTLVILDVLVEPACRGQGVGTRLLAGFLAQAGAAGRTVLLHVDKINPARRLYERLGFRITGDAGIAYEMVWTPTPEA